MDWYASYWNHRTHVGWTGELHPGWNAVSIYQAQGADTFVGFLEQVVAEGVPFISQHADLFKKMDRVGRFEDLRNELCAILTAAGEDVDCALVQTVPPQNVIPYPGKGWIDVPRSLYSAMVNLEAWSFEFFGYAEESRRFNLI